ncbi:nucleotidyltransferase family protein [Antarcticibacterium sp. 1MA-6-2]|uniref:nucleotidyltransferase family protein n=1 Tax=Antarcticibacterium sp. 1MA-6-2 TaxID=2908210 RepID=UPI001F2C43EC|nr:nucleotidyltransferase family protein [Antarcticibacterium sp. 1MA-6-2]UJH90970.1 nucleotidyltransferase family protein [Antarcticibacterium sp. 1MA-6-2]
MREKAKIGVVILAVGSSSRLGYPKQLVEFRGIPLLQHVVSIACSLEFDCRILVLGAIAEEIKKEVSIRNFKVAINEDWKEGMGTSISKGIFEAEKIEKALDYILILLSDQPLITRERIQELINVQLKTEKQATFSEYAGELGVPAIFSKECFSELKKLKKDQGGKKLILDGKREFETIKFEGGNFDVDTREDVERLKRMERS